MTTIPTDLQLTTTVIERKKIKANKDWNSRTSYTDIDSLAEDISKNGLISPIIVREIESGQYRVIVGFRRFAAIEKIKLDPIPCQIFTGDEKQALLLNLRENVHRQALTTFELASRCARMKTEHGMSGAEIGAQIGKDRNYVNRLIQQLEKLEKPILDAWSNSAHPANGLCNTENLNRLVSMEPEAQLVYWDELRGHLPADEIEEGEERTKTEKPKRPTLLQQTTAIEALKTSELPKETIAIAVGILRWCSGAARTLRVSGQLIYDQSKKAKKSSDESEE